jgi:hypothetical protein
MDSKMKCVAIMLAVGASAAMASISLDFNVDSGYTGPSRLRISSDIISYNFTVDGSGNVTLDAEAVSTDANATNTVNSWDGAVGTVTDAALYNTSFTLTAQGYRRVNDGSSYASTDISMDGEDGGGIGVFGQNGSLIDGATLATTNLEQIVWTLSGNVVLDFSSFDYGDWGGSPDIELSTGATNVTYLNIPTTEPADVALNMDISSVGFSIGNGESLTFAAPADASNGISIAGLNFTASIPEPATLGLIAAFGGSILFIRRRIMM